MATATEIVSIFPDTLLESDETSDGCELGEATDRPETEEDRISPGGLGDDRERRWWLIYTKARQEKALARELLRFELPFYLPLVTKTTVHGKRRSRSHVPLFTGYVFLWGDDEERVASLKTNRISRVLPVGDGDGLVRDLRQIRHLIASGAPLTHESLLAKGHRVRVRSGPLRNLEGTVMVRRGATRLLVAVDFLQQGASVAIDDFLLERID